jgi:hypothetical protein
MILISFCIDNEGGLAGMLSWTISFPFDCVKSIIQDQVHIKHHNMIKVAKDIYAEKGIKGYFKGIFELKLFIYTSKNKKILRNSEFYLSQEMKILNKVPVKIRN